MEERTCTRESYCVYLLDKILSEPKYEEAQSSSKFTRYLFIYLFI